MKTYRTWSNGGQCESRGLTHDDAEAELIAHVGMMTEQEKYNYAVADQGYAGSYEEWQAMDAAERAEYEDGAAGIPTA